MFRKCHGVAQSVTGHSYYCILERYSSSHNISSCFFSILELIYPALLQHLPRFQGQNLEHNKTIFERVNEMATRKGCTPAQLALAWVHHQGDDVVPIPGTTKVENFNQNIGALSVKLTPEEMAQLESFALAGAVKGDRYGDMVATWKQSETPSLSSWKGQ